RTFRLSLVLPAFIFKATATTGIYTLSLHDALPISACGDQAIRAGGKGEAGAAVRRPSGYALAAAEAARRGEGRRQAGDAGNAGRSEEHTSELQSRGHLVCRLLLEKKKQHGGTRAVP